MSPSEAKPSVTLTRSKASRLPRVHLTERSVLYGLARICITPFAQIPKAAANLIRQQLRPENAGFAAQQSPSPTDFRIFHASGSFVPQPGAHDFGDNTSVAETISAQGSQRVFIVQFSRPITSSEWLSLLDLGAIPLEGISREAVVYLVPSSSLHAIADLPFVRWLGAWRLEYKLNSRELSKGKPIAYVESLGPLVLDDTAQIWSNLASTTSLKTTQLTLSYCTEYRTANSVRSRTSGGCGQFFALRWRFPPKVISTSVQWIVGSFCLLPR